MFIKGLIFLAVSFVLVIVDGDNLDYGRLFYNLAVIRSNSSSSHTFNAIHLMRIPKASSSSLSAVARRAVGCTPPGPCCKWPGDPPGSCPSKGLFECQLQNKVIGCTHHYPNYDALLNSSLLSISIIREPKSRSVSAFFYPGIHHNSECSGGIDKCFKEYTRSPRWKNIAVKMMTGLYAYALDPVCKHAEECLHSLELALHNLDSIGFMGIAELWELSMLLFHVKFPQIPPSLEEFSVYSNASQSAGTNDIALRRGLMDIVGPELGEVGDRVGTMSRSLIVDRENHGQAYSEFKKTGPVVYAKELHDQNALDEVLYQKAVSNMCRDLHASQLWTREPGGETIREYWRVKSLYKTAECP